MSDYLPPMEFQKITVYPERERGMWLIGSGDLARLLQTDVARLPDPATSGMAIHIPWLQPESFSPPIVTAVDRSRVARFAYYLTRLPRRRYTR